MLYFCPEMEQRREGELWREAVIFFLISPSLSSVNDTREGIFPSGYSAGEGCPGERCICLESVTQAKQRRLPRGRMNSFMPLTPWYHQPSCLGPTRYTQTHTYVHIHPCLCGSPRDNRCLWGRIVTGPDSCVCVSCTIFSKIKLPHHYTTTVRKITYYSSFTQIVCLNSKLNVTRILCSMK